ncbi:hypothetical protein BBK82_40755 [Lentzea guizhouensis]|uniref:Uncharacterized protein n=1 Tax=Lentzea guizhouensis TaxID=1586287 RepID=A0A1B2HUH4_9PSEU|nr:hypothetical protein [Lentzea guizhouensis]ANZ41357.1 hypothetical protein BBK82_40755 [Lentzea guizhouensis]
MAERVRVRVRGLVGEKDWALLPAFPYFADELDVMVRTRTRRHGPSIRTTITRLGEEHRETEEAHHV